MDRDHCKEDVNKMPKKNASQERNLGKTNLSKRGVEAMQFKRWPTNLKIDTTLNFKPSWGWTETIAKRCKHHKCKKCFSGNGTWEKQTCPAEELKQCGR